MNFLVLLFTLEIIFSSINAAAIHLSKQKNSTLVLLHVLFRHGNRTPDEGSTFANDLYANSTYEPYGHGQLTLKGKRTEYNIGKYIRENYGEFIPQQYTPQLVKAVSTNLKRTKMSLELVLTALFPPLLNERIDILLNWQPIPFIIESDSDRIISPAFLYCLNYVSDYYDYLLSKEGQSIIAEYKDLYDKLTKLTGSDILTPKDAANIYVTLKSQDDMGLQLPSWAGEVYPEILEDAAGLDYELSTATSDLTKLSAGFLLKQIIQDSLDKKNGDLDEGRKVFLYSAHEYNVATTLRALNVFRRHVPPFGATIYFEIHEIDGEYGLKLFYEDYTEDKPRLLTIPGCTEICPLKTLLTLIEDYLPTEDDVCSTSGELF